MLYESALTVMMRLVFLFCDEERELIPSKPFPVYEQNYSVSTISKQLRELADQNGEELLERRCDAWPRLLAAFRAVFGGLSKRVPHHQHRDMAFAFVDRWRSEAADDDARTVAVALQSVALSEQAHRDSQSVELAWTGPDTEATLFRRTEQAILQVLDAAKTRITLVSFAVYRIPNIGKALVRAARRGVRLTVIVETPDKIEGEGEYSTIKVLGQEVAACSTVYFWPKENRPVGDKNKTGILHVKCAVADRQWLFLSSANLTQQAFTINMELGILVRGGSMPIRVEQQFERLIQIGQLRAV